MSRANDRVTRMTLGSGALDGYNGPADIVTLPSRSWWRKLLRLRSKSRTTRVFVDVRGSSARTWRR